MATMPVNDKDHNFALLKPTAQSSTKASTADVISGALYESKYAVDGIKATSCSKSGVPACANLADVDTDQWWRVDLEVVIPVARVAVTNRKDYYSTLKDFEIKIGNSLVNEGLDNPKCGARHLVPFGETKSISCSPQ